MNPTDYLDIHTKKLHHREGAGDSSLNEMIASRHRAGVFVIKHTHSHTPTEPGSVFPSHNFRKLKRLI